MTVVEIEGCKFYIDKKLKTNMDKIKKRVNQKDEDYFWAIDGEEGSGKSVLALQLAKYVDPSFCLDRVVFDPEQFRSAILNAKKGQAVVFDEAFRGLSSRGALTQINKLLVSLMMECRQKNLFVFVVLPTFFLLEKYVALFRAKGLFHVYRKKGKRGFWVYFNKKKKKWLYLKGKNTYSYKEPISSFRGRFLNRYTVSEKKYREKKKDSLSDVDEKKNVLLMSQQKDLLLWLANRELGLSTMDLMNRLESFDWKIGKQTINDAVLRAEKRLKQRGVLM